MEALGQLDQAREHYASALAEFERLGAGLGMGAIVAFPIFYGLIGVVSGLVTAGLYNLVAGMTGGLEIDVQ